MSGDLGIIRRGVAAMEHDVSFWSLFMGPHILFDDLVGYCDGRQLLLFGARLGTREPASDGQINEVFDYAVDRLGVGYFECWRPGAPPCLARPDWATGSYREDAVPLAIPLSGFSVEGSTERAKQVRQADRRGFVFEENLSPNLESGDLRLIEDFLQGRQLTPFDMAYTFIAPYFTWAREGRTFRVRREGRTCALGTVSTFAPHVTTFVHTFVDRSARGASDLLYSGIIDFARARGSAHLDLGYSGTASLEEYKRSWGAVDRGECNQGTWARRAGEPTSAFFHWPMRMLAGDQF